LAPAHRLHADVQDVDGDASADGYRLPTFQIDDVGFRIARSIVR
jgi:hypothetical protein